MHQVFRVPTGVLPAIAQLVERSTVELAGIEWSLGRFRVAGFFFFDISVIAEGKRVFLTDQLHIAARGRGNDFDCREGEGCKVFAWYLL